VALHDLLQAGAQCRGVYAFVQMKDEGRL